MLCLRSRYARAGEPGVAPEMFISQPTGVIPYDYYPCEKDPARNHSLIGWQPDGTPVVCTVRIQAIHYCKHVCFML